MSRGAGGRRAVLIALAATWVGCHARKAAAQAGPPHLRIGDAVPDLAAKTSGGDTVRLGALRGQVLIVNFFASYCAPCRTELPLLGELTERLAAEARLQPGRPQPRLLPVGVDARPEDAARFAASLGVKAAVLLDPGGVVRTAFDPQRYPCTFLIDSEGVVRHINRGFGPGYPARMERWLRALLALPPPPTERRAPP